VVLGKREDFKCLNTPAERLILLESLGVSCTITQPFDQDFAAQTAEEFARRMLRALGVRHLVIGHDRALGRGREGNAARLEELGRGMGFSVEVVPPVHAGGEIISSSRIRRLVEAGEVAEAAELLGRPHSLAGTVVHGDGRGRHINIPTANLELPKIKLIPGNGIYATWAWVGRERLPAATNIGINPTFTPGKQAATVEAHILDLDRDLYGQEIRLEFVSRLREERRFASVEALVRQIRADIESTRKILR
jgi:riboflavin kinase/FMN adenylyltransferase